MNRLNEIKRMITFGMLNEKKKEVRDDSFTADKGRFTYKVNTIIPKSKLVEFFVLMKRKVPNVKQSYSDLALDTFKVDKETLLKMEKKIINEICTFQEIVSQVKTDLPNFRLISTTAEEMIFTQIDEHSYRVEIVLSGACEGD